MQNRISKEEYYLAIAKAVAKRSTCIRRQYGCVIVNNDEIVATGYNGAPRGLENCCDTGYCFRDKNNIPHGTMYEECVAVHAEQNAIISASRAEMLGATAYLAGFEKHGNEYVELNKVAPCKICERLLRNAGIEKVITNNEIIHYYPTKCKGLETWIELRK